METSPNSEPLIPLHRSSPSAPALQASTQNRTQPTLPLLVRAAPVSHPMRLPILTLFVLTLTCSSPKFHPAYIPARITHNPENPKYPGYNIQVRLRYRAGLQGEVPKAWVNRVMFQNFYTATSDLSAWKGLASN